MSSILGLADTVMLSKDRACQVKGKEKEVSIICGCFLGWRFGSKRSMGEKDV